MDRETARIALTIVFVVVALALSALLVASGRRGPNLWAAAWLTTQALFVAFVAVAFMTTDAAVFTYAVAADGGLGSAAPILFLLFVGSLPGRATRLLRTPVARVALLALAAVAFILPFVAATHLVVPVRSPDGGWGNAGSGPFEVVVVSILAIPPGLFLLWRLRCESAPGTLARARANSLLVALVVFAGYTALQSGFMLGLEAVSHPVHIAYMDGPWGVAFLSIGLPVTQIAGVALLAYGVLKTQLFDIDLRVRAGLVRGSVAGAFLVVFFAVEQLAQTLVSDAFGIALGLVAAALLVLVLKPLERAADRLADRVMPRVHDTPEFRDARKEDVYRAAVRDALADRVLTRAEESDLAALAAELGFDPRRALSLRDDVERELGFTLGDRAASA